MTQYIMLHVGYNTLNLELHHHTCGIYIIMHVGYITLHLGVHHHACGIYINMHMDISPSFRSTSSCLWDFIWEYIIMHVGYTSSGWGQYRKIGTYLKIDRKRSIVPIFL